MASSGTGMPQLPQRRKERAQKKAQAASIAAQGPDVEVLRQPLLSNRAFQRFVDAPDTLCAVLHSDPVLSAAAAADPQVAALLDPATLQQALGVLRRDGQPGPGDQQAPAVQGMALLQLQHYATQLQQARTAGQLGVLQPTTPQQEQPQQPVTAAGDNAGSRQQEMWAAMQQRMHKLQQRGSMVQQLQASGHAHAGQQGGEEAQPGTSPAAAAAAAAQQAHSSAPMPPAGWEQQQQQQPVVSAFQGGSGPAVASPFGDAAPGGAAAGLERRTSSSLSHRVWRHSSGADLMDAMMCDLARSGSQALSIEQLGSGDVILGITPPTRVTQELTYSTDPTAAYVLEAASPHSMAGPPSVSPHTAGVSATAAQPAAAAAAVAASGGAWAEVELGDGTADSSSAAAATAAQHLQQPGQQVSQRWQQQQQQPTTDNSNAAGLGHGASASRRSSRSAVTAAQPGDGPCCQHSAAAGGGAAAGAGAALDAKTYYEAVAPSGWRPSETGSYGGDYLEMYRRAYCSYADALFPPLWLGLLSAAASLRLLPLWQLLLLGAASFWGGLYVMAVRWAGVPPAQLGLSRVTPMLVVCLEALATGAFALHVLPAMWFGGSLLCVLTLAAAAAMLAFHAMAFLQDPGYTPLPDTEEGGHTGRAAAGGGTPSSSGLSDSGRHAPAAELNNNNTNSSSSSTAAGQPAPEQQPLLSGAGSGSGSGSGSGAAQQQRLHRQQMGGANAPRVNGKTMTSCWTCGVERNLRSKHCPVCKRCVERFDHHCPVLGNCVGAGNHKAFVCFLAAMLASQLLFCHLTLRMLLQSYLLTAAATAAAAPAAAEPSAAATAASLSAAAGGWGLHGWRVTLLALWAAGGSHPGLLLLLLAQVPTMCMSSCLLLRALALAAANLTVNEWLNRGRYLYLQHEGRFCNRFDEGVAANCAAFWVGPPVVDWWAAWEAAEQVLQRRGTAALVGRAPTLLIRFWDKHWARYQQQLLEGRARRRELQMQRRMQALGLHESAA